MTVDLCRLGIAEARDRLVSEDVTSVELTRACLDAMAVRRDLNAFISETPEIALDRAAAADARRLRGDTIGPLDGIPIAIKDQFCTQGV